MCGHRLRYVMILGTDFADYAEKIKKKSVLFRVIPRPERGHDKVFRSSPESPA